MQKLILVVIIIMLKPGRQPDSSVCIAGPDSGGVSADSSSTCPWVWLSWVSPDVADRVVGLLVREFNFFDTLSLILVMTNIN